jgi:formylglycine-generating enzyme required for sulfatase activity
MRQVRWAIATMLVLAVVACGSTVGGGAAGGKSMLGESCASTADCAGVLRCIDLKCTEVDAGGTDTSTSGDVVGNGASVPPSGMVLIPAGTFWMGCNAAKDGGCNADEKPQHKVTLSAYYIDLNETTVGEYKACVDAKACSAPSVVQPAQHATYPGLTNNPVNFVNWAQSQAFCKWRGLGYDLPTEAQWEMAARGSCEKNGSTAGDPACATAMRTYPWGEVTATCSFAVMDGNGGWGCGTNATWPVGQKAAGDSPYGLHDMAGNVCEWSRDWQATYPGEAQTDPVGPDASNRVYRGGGIYAVAGYLRSGNREPDAPSASYSDLGLRCVRSSF